MVQIQVDRFTRFTQVFTFFPLLPPRHNSSCRICALSRISTLFAVFDYPSHFFLGENLHGRQSSQSINFNFFSSFQFDAFVAVRHEILEGDDGVAMQDNWKWGKSQRKRVKNWDFVRRYRLFLGLCVDRHHDSLGSRTKNLCWICMIVCLIWKEAHRFRLPALTAESSQLVSKSANVMFRSMCYVTQCKNNAGWGLAYHHQVDLKR